MFESVTGHGPTVDEVGEWIRLASYLLNGLAAIAGLVVSIARLARMRRDHRARSSQPTSKPPAEQTETPAGDSTTTGTLTCPEQARA